MQQPIDFFDVPFQWRKKKKDKISITLAMLYMGILTFMVIAIALYAANLKRQNTQLENRLSQQQYDFKTTRQKDGSQIATQQQKIYDMIAKQQLLENTLNRFKSVKSQVVVGVTTDISPKSIAYHDTVYRYVDSTDKMQYLRVPVHFSAVSPYYHIDGTIDYDSLRFDSFSVYNEIVVTTGRTKAGLFKKEQYIIEVKSKNPHSTITKVQNQQFEPKRPWYKKFIAGFGAGAATTYYIWRRTTR